MKARTRNRKQSGSLKIVKRLSGLEVWVYRWRERSEDGRRRPRKVVVGAVADLPSERSARKALADLEIDPNLDPSNPLRPPRNVSALMKHYTEKELTNRERIAFATAASYQNIFANWIEPKWGKLTMSRLDKVLAVEVEEWLGSINRENATRSKIKYTFSALCSHAKRWGWLRSNPVRGARQSAKTSRKKVPLAVEELQALFDELGLMDRVLVLLDVPTGMRVGELLALRWCDIDWEQKTLAIQRAIWHQQIGRVKTAGSARSMPLDDAMIADLRRWRGETPYAKDEDWVFASPRQQGKQPYWPEALIDNLREAAKRAGIKKHLTWHVFRHTFSTLLIANGEDVKTVQSLLRHSTARLTLDIYTHAVQARERQAQSKVVQMILPTAKIDAACAAV